MSGRTEVDVAADTIARLVLDGILDRANITTAEQRTGLLPGETRAAIDRIKRTGWTAPRRIEAPPGYNTPPAPPAPPARSDLPSTFGDTGARRSRGVSSIPQATRRCARCTDLKPVTEFAAKDSTGRLRSFCIPCMKAYQRSRYLSRSAIERLAEAGLTIKANDTGAIEAFTCTVCGDAIGHEDAEASVLFTGFHHARCTPADQITVGPARQPAIDATTVFADLAAAIRSDRKPA